MLRQFAITEAREAMFDALLGIVELLRLIWKTERILFLISMK